MVTTLNTLVRKSMQKSGILTKTQQPAADEANDAVDAINDMLASWANDSMLCYARKWETFNMTGGVGLYTMGTGGMLNTPRPINIISSHMTDGTIDYWMKPIRDDIYNDQIQMKQAPGIPYYLQYDGGYPLQTLRLWPIPPSSLYSLFILSEKPLSSYGLNDVIDLPPGWERAIIFNGAIEIAGDYGQEPPDTVVKIARESRQLIEKATIRSRNLDATPQMGAKNNVYSGWNTR